jgi:hypothetical protein
MAALNYTCRLTILNHNHQLLPAELPEGQEVTAKICASGKLQAAEDAAAAEPADGMRGTVRQTNIATPGHGRA